MRRNRFWLIAICIAGMLLSIGMVVRSISQRPLAPLEARLVGQWDDNERNATRSFGPDRRFSTADGQFEGKWSMVGDQLILEYWIPFRLSEVDSLGDLRSKLRESGRRYTVAWKIEFGDDGQTHTLINPHDHPVAPGKKWKWRRRLQST